MNHPLQNRRDLILFQGFAHTFQGGNSSTLRKRPFKGASESTHCIIENSYALPWASGEKMADTFKVMGAGNVSYSFLTHGGGETISASSIGHGKARVMHSSVFTYGKGKGIVCLYCIPLKKRNWIVKYVESGRVACGSKQNTENVFLHYFIPF